MHAENTLYWLALPLNRSGSVAPASELDKVWTAFFKGLNVADLTAACKTRSLPVVAATDSVKQADFVTALQACMHSHSRVISSFHDAQLLGLEASTNWWCAYDVDQGLQGLRFTVIDSVSNGMRRRVAEMLQVNDGPHPFAPAQPPPVYQNSRQMPQWPQPSAAGGPPPSWAAPQMQGFTAGLPTPTYNPPQGWPGADVQRAAHGNDTAPPRPQRQEVPNVLGGMPRLGEQNALYHSRQLPDGPGPHGAASNDPHCQAYLALQNTPVMALILDSARVGRWQMCKNYWPALEPNLQGDYLGTVVL